MYQIINDCIFNYLPTVEDAFFDLIIADIPYYQIVKEDWDNQWESYEHYLEWLDLLFREFARILKNDKACYVYSSISHYPHIQLLLNKYLTYSATITWKKQRGRGNGWGFNREEICVNVKGNHIFKQVETQTLMLPHLRKGKKDYSNGKQIERKRDYKLATSVWDDISQVCSYRKQLHPTEKPVENARRMLEASSEIGDLVFIPFAGSGSECESCARMGRNFVAIEANLGYHGVIVERVEQVINGCKRNIEE